MQIIKVVPSSINSHQEYDLKLRSKMRGMVDSPFRVDFNSLSSDGVAFGSNSSAQQR